MMKWSYRNSKTYPKGKEKAYLREGVALQNLGQHGESLGALAEGLAQEQNNAQLLSGLMEAAMKSPLKEKLGPVFNQLQKLKLSQSPFVIISVIGQELLAIGQFKASVRMLEASLAIGTCSLKLRGSVFSALSSAYWGMGDLDSAITNMQHDLSVAKSLGDLEGECRAHGNLGSAYFSKGQYKDALSNHRYQLALAMKLKKRDAAASALGSLGHVYTAIGDYPNALNSHKQCLFLMKQSGDKLAEAREIGNAGAVYLAMGEFQHAIDCHQKHLQMAKNLKNMVEEARAYSNLGSAYHYKRDYEKAMLYHKQVLQIGESKKDKVLEARAYAGLGHAARCMQDYDKAKEFHEKQLDNALQTKDKVAEGRACSNLGIIYHQLKEYKNALKLHEVHLKIAKNLGDRASQGRAYGNLGNAHCSMGQYDQAIKFHKLELSIASDVNDRHSEGTTHGNLAVALQSTGKPDKALQHYQLHLQISKELKDTVSEARALCNLGNFFSSKGDHSSAVSYYEEYLNLSQELLDSEGEAKACFNLGYAHFALGNHIEAVRYYEQDLSIAKELKDQLGMARAYCNLGLAHTALKNFEDALECQKMCLSMMKSMKNTKGIFRALGNIGDITLKTGDTAEAIKIYNQQLQLAKQCNKKDLIASSYGALGAAHRILGQYDKALGYHTQELSIRQDMDDLRGECRAHGNLGSVHMALGNYQNAFKCYTEQLEKSQELQDSALEAQASGNLGITRMNMGMYDDAIGMFEHQLAMLEQVSGLTSTLDKGHAFGNLGDCYESLGDFEESIKCHNQFLAISQQTNNLSDQDKAYRGLGNAHRSVGNLQQALWCFEKRLVVAHELNSSASKASAYGELGCLHSLLGNFEQAISCLQHQLSIAQEIQDQICEGEAACGLGGVYQQMGEYDKALEYHKMDLEIAEATGNKACQCRAYGNLGLSHESLFNYKEAKAYQEQHLSIAAEINDRVAKTLAYSSLGRVHHAMNNHAEAVDYLRQGLQIAEQLGRNEEEAKIRHRLGLSLWGKGDLEECYQQLYKAADLFEGIRRDAQFNSEYKMSLFDLQTACYQALQRVLVTLKRHDEALVIAERACTRAFIDYLLERQAGAKGLYKGHMDPPPITSDQIVNLVSKQKSLVLCYSVAAGYLYCWLLAPNKGIVKFHEANMVDLEALDTDSFHDNLSMKSISFTSSSMLDQYVGQVRESMGIERHSSRLSLPGKSGDCESDSEEDEEWQQHLEELGDKLNAENDKTGFLRMVNRNHKMNSSSYSLSSMYSLSANGLGSSFHSIHRTRSINNRAKESGKAPVSALYQLLIEPLEEAIASCVQEMGATGPVDLVLVVQGELYLIPFSVLRKDQNSSFLFERFNLCIMPSITALQNAHKHDKQGRPVIDSSGAIVVGNPKLSANVLSNWHLKEIPSSEYEARIVGEILTCRPLIGAEATKAAVIQQIEQVEVLHFATHLSWKLSSIILASSDNIPPHHHRFPTIDISDDSASDISSFDGPILSEYLLTAADILNLKLHAKLVVLSSGYTDDRAGRINSDGVVGLTRALLSAGAQCVLFSLWPVPDQAAKLLMRTFYSSLQEGMCATQALSTAMRGVQSNKQFSHASNWGGWVLVGHDIKLSSKVALMGHAICEILQCQTQCREAMRVLLHLIEKSLQRIHQGIKNSMYTTSQSIENKVFGVPGWKDLLQAVGFRFESATNGLPPAAYFPQTDPGDRLTRASASLQALLGLPPSALAALSKFLHNYEAGEANIRVMRDILSKMAAKESNIEIQIIVSLWRDIPGCHEFLASLGLDLVDVGQDEVTLRLGKQANRRQLQFALQSLVAVFDTSEAPKSLSIDSSSSLESLSSSHSGSTSTSNFSKGSTPPLSPHGSRKRSLFNPAEMEKMRMQNKMHLMNQGGLSGRQLGRKHLRQQVDPALHLSLQSQVRTRYPLGSAGSRLTEVSENSESDIEGRKSGDGSWGERMHVSTNSESDSSIIADVFPDHHNPTFVDENGQESLDHLQTGSPVVMETEEYSLSRHDSQQSADRFSFTHDDNIRKSSMSRNSVSSEDSIYFQKSGTGLPQQASDQGNIEVSNANEEKENVKVISEDSQELFSEKITLESTQDNLDPEINSTESGIHSGMTSSNQSDISQQSTEGLTFDPTELSLKVMQEIGDTKQVIDDLQRESFINSKKETCLKRQSYQQQLSNPNIDRSGVIVPEKSLNSNLSVADQIKSKIPPPVPSKPKIAPKPSTFESTLQRLISTDDSDKDVEKTTNEDKDSQSTSANQNQHKPAISGDNNVTVVTSPDSNSVQIKTNTSSSIPLAPVSSSSAPLRSFRPQPKSRVLNSMQRPDSTTSTSSWCSSASSVQSVIHRPLIGSLKDVKETNLDAESCSSSQSSPHPECGNNRPLPPYDGTNAAYYLHRGSPIQQYYSSSSASSTPTWKHSNSSPDIGQFSASRTGPVWKPANSTPDISQHSANGKPMQSSNPAHHQPVSTNAPGAVNRLDSLLETCQVQSADYGQKLNSSYMNQSLNSSGNSVTSTSHNMPVNQKYLLDNSGSSLGSFQNLNSSSDSFQEMGNFPGPKKRTVSSGIVLRSRANCVSPANSTQSGGSPLPRSTSPSSSITSRGSPCQYLGHQNKAKSILNSSPMANSGGKKRPTKRVSFSDSEPSDLENHSPNLFSPNKAGMNGGLMKIKPGDYSLPMTTKVNGVPPSSSINPVTGLPLHHGYNKSMSNIKSVPGHYPLCNGTQVKLGHEANGYALHSLGPPNGDIVLGASRTAAYPFPPRQMNGHGQAYLNLNETDNKTMSQGGVPSGTVRSQVLYTSKC